MNKNYSAKGVKNIPENTKVANIILVRRGIAYRNFLRHIKDNNIEKIKSQIERGSVKIVK